jgi:hypothetical protein
LLVSEIGKPDTNSTIGLAFDSRRAIALPDIVKESPVASTSRPNASRAKNTPRDRPSEE